jgi:hypothetical protein
MSIQTHFNKFNTEIYLTNRSDAYKDAKKKDKSILDAIKAKFKEEGYQVQESFLQGSFAVETAIKNNKGDYDIDRSVVIKEEDAPTDPVEPKKAVLKVLESRNFQNAKVKIPCITADYQNKKLHIDYTVYLKDEVGNYNLAVGKVGSSDQNKKWAPSDPRGLVEWISGSDNYGTSSAVKRKQYKRLVRFVKRWRDVTFSDGVKKKIFSIGLTVMIKHEYKPDYFTTEVEDDLNALKKVVDNIISAQYFSLESFNPEQYRVSVHLPRSPYTSIFRHKNSIGIWTDGSDKNIGTQLRNQFVKLQKILGEALGETDEIKQCEILNGVFGNDFKIPETSANGNPNSSGSKAATVFPVAGAVGTSQGAFS